MLNNTPDTEKQVDWLLQQAHAEPVDLTKAWSWLEAAHIAGQTRFLLHLRVHWNMLLRSLADSNWAEVWAQVVRLALVPLGHLMQRLPLGNPGSSRVAASQPMPIPAHLAALIAQSRSVCTASTS
jgi:Protein of unknown function (DUF3703)